jgi:hypothetical protein
MQPVPQKLDVSSSELFLSRSYDMRCTKCDSDFKSKLITSNPIFRTYAIKLFRQGDRAKCVRDSKIVQF